MLDDLGEGLRKQGFALDEMLLGNRDDSITGDLNNSCLV